MYVYTGIHLLFRQVPIKRRNCGPGVNEIQPVRASVRRVLFYPRYLFYPIDLHQVPRSPYISSSSPVYLHYPRLYNDGGATSHAREWDDAATYA